MNTLVFYDIGARGDLPHFVKNIDQKMKFFRFEPEGSSVCTSSNNDVLIKTALSDQCKAGKVYLTKSRVQSSVYKPNLKLLNNFDQQDHSQRIIDDVLDIDFETLDNLYSRDLILLPDWIKCDTQGSEFVILKGAKEIIKRSLPLLGLETWTREIYENVPLFTKVFELCSEYGYEMAALSNAGRIKYKANDPNVLKYSRPHQAALNLLFLPKIDKLEATCDKDIIKKRAIVAALNGFTDYAHQLIEITGDKTVLKLINIITKKHSSLSYKIINKIRDYLTKMIDYPSIT